MMSIWNTVRYFFIGLVFLHFYLYSPTFAEATWSSDPSINTPVVVNSQRQDVFKVLSDGEGGAYVLVIDQVNNGGIYLQRLDNNGDRPWGAEEKMIGRSQSWVSAPLSMIADSEKGVIIVWEEMRNNVVHIYAQRINLEGILLWGENGLLISSNISQNAIQPRAVTDNYGGVIISWAYHSGSGTTQVRAQRVSKNGSPMWGIDGVIIAGFAYRDSISKIASDGNGGAYVLYRGNNSQTLLTQHVDVEGNILLASGGKLVSNTTTGPIAQYEFISDNIGGVYLRWNTIVNGVNDRRHQRMISNGEYLWGENGLTLPFSGRMISDNNGDLYIITNVPITPSDWDIVINKIVKDGSIGWSGNFVEIVKKPEIQSLSQFIVDEVNNILITWNDQTDRTNTDIYAQRINSDGQLLWSEGGIIVSSAPSNQLGAAIDQLDNNSYLVAWTDTRNGSSSDDIYAQKVNLDGTLGDFTLPTPTPVKHFELPVSHVGRMDGTIQQFKTAFWNTLTAAFDHELEKGTYRPFTGATHIPKDCPKGVLGILCYDSHNGTDFSHINGLNVYSVANGNVLYVSDNDVDDQCIEESSYGCVALVEYDHPSQEGEQLVGLYAHLSKIDVVAGDEVSAITKIGDMGKTGCKSCGTNPHLHFSVLKEVGLAPVVQKQKSLSKRMTKKDWQNLLAELPDEDNKKNEDDLYGGTKSSGKAYCTYNAPNGIRFAFLDPSGWKSQEIDPWSLPIDFTKKESGCGLSSSYLWKYEVGTSL